MRRFRRRVRKMQERIRAPEIAGRANSPAADELGRSRPAGRHLRLRSGCSLQSAFRGRRPRSRVLRGGSFNNNAQNVRSANRNNNQPDNRNNNNGFRPASTLRQTLTSALPESAGPVRRAALRSVPSAKSRPSSRVGSGLRRFGRMKNRPGGSGRPQGSNAPPGHGIRQQWFPASPSVRGRTRLRTAVWPVLSRSPAGCRPQMGVELLNTICRPAKKHAHSRHPHRRFLQIPATHLRSDMSQWWLCARGLPSQRKAEPAVSGTPYANTELAKRL